MSVTLYTPDCINRGHMRETSDSEQAFVELRDYDAVRAAFELLYSDMEDFVNLDVLRDNPSALSLARTRVAQFKKLQETLR